MTRNIDALHDDLIAWRRDIHKHPETAFEEVRTSDLVAAKLAEWGLEVHRGLGRTGVVGTLRAGSSSRAIGLRADMDALHIQELNSFGHRSVNNGKMHACGHDGHTTMLLGAARVLAETRNFDGVLHFIFQPAEENEGGARAMIEEGLFDKFPVEAVYGMHNMPGIPAGRFAMRKGPIMAASDRFELTIRGAGGHAAFPHRATDPVVIGAELVSALQTIVSRNRDPLAQMVLSITQFHAGDTWNVIPDSAVLRGSVRTFDTAVQDQVIAAIDRIAGGICAAHGASHVLDYQRGYPAVVNSGPETEVAAEVASAVTGADRVDDDVAPVMGSEDFAFMLQKRPGCYVFIGNGDRPGDCMVHNPHYDFNDDILPTGVRYWVKLAETTLAAARSPAAAVLDSRMPC